MSFSLANLNDRKKAAPARPAGDRARLFDEDTNWWPLVRAAFLAALTAFFVKLAALGWLAANNDINLEVRFWKGFIPHLGMQTPPTDFAEIVTWSTFIMALASTGIFAMVVMSSKLPKMTVWGWFMGVFVTLETLVLELLRHVLEPPVVDTGAVWRTFIPLAAGIGIAVAYGMITRERREKPAPAVRTPRAVVAAP